MQASKQVNAVSSSSFSTDAYAYRGQTNIVNPANNADKTCYCNTSDQLREREVDHRQGAVRQAGASEAIGLVAEAEQLGCALAEEGEENCLVASEAVVVAGS